MARYAVVGLGLSGLSAVKYLVARGHDVAVTDGGQPTLAGRLPDGVATYFGGIDSALLANVDTVVISPGINPNIDAVCAAKMAGIPVISDVQLFIDALRARDAQFNTHTPIVAITGSNAKSTVTTLVGLMATDNGYTVGVGGNIGTPALQLLDIDAMDMVVLELSSFQLEHINNLNADVATILNLSADHLDRHGDMANYLTEKLKVLNGARVAVICLDDKLLADMCYQALRSETQIYTTTAQLTNIEADFYLAQKQDDIWLCYDGVELLSADKLLIKGRHNLLNALSALALGYAIGLSINVMVQTLGHFRGLPHRCQYVAEVGSKAYFNDSKGTNIGSTLAAIDGLGSVYGAHSLALILGGQGKGQDFAELSHAVCDYVAAVYLIGQDATKIATDITRADATLATRLHHVGTLDRAVSAAHASDVKAVLLSPACASFDQFDGYPHRGEVFVDLVHALAKNLS